MYCLQWWVVIHLHAIQGQVSINGVNGESLLRVTTRYSIRHVLSATGGLAIEGSISCKRSRGRMHIMDANSSQEKIDAAKASITSAAGQCSAARCDITVIKHKVE